MNASQQLRLLKNYWPASQGKVLSEALPELIELVTAVENVADQSWYEETQWLEQLNKTLSAFAAKL
jgi:hypothetical protein